MLKECVLKDIEGMSRIALANLLRQQGGVKYNRIRRLQSQENAHRINEPFSFLFD
jgi:hypothetical protein